MRITDHQLDSIIETKRKKSAKKQGIEYRPLRGKPGSKIRRRLLRNNLRRDIYQERMGII